MKHLDEFRDGVTARELGEKITRLATRPMRLMEVCGTHTMAIARHGLKALLPDTVLLLSGPGCPVCVTPQLDIDRFMAMGAIPDVILTSFGDMLRVPGSTTNLEKKRAEGVDVRIVYGPLDAVKMAQDNPERKVIFCGVGFETTAPTVALAIKDAARLGLQNFFVYCAHKTMPQALLALACDPESAIDGFLCPGHVSSIIGSDTYIPIAQQAHKPCVIAGFEPLDMLQAIYMLVKQIVEGRADVEVPYNRVVAPKGNPLALAAIDEVFCPSDAEWRGLGCIPGSGLAIRPEFAAFDALQFLPQLGDIPTPKPTACECGLILQGRKSPQQCHAFGKACTPANPVGPCMVSSEGACAAAYRFAPPT